LRRGGLGGPRFAYLRLCGSHGVWARRFGLLQSAVAAPVAASAITPNLAGANPPFVKMQAGDHINVTVYNEASLSGNYSIDSGGFVTIPRAGRLRAAGLTPTELADLLVKKFRGEYFNNPKVTVAPI
jgi:protein involved in polysaccharide export with SLBB domain